MGDEYKQFDATPQKLKKARQEDNFDIVCELDNDYNELRSILF